MTPGGSVSETCDHGSWPGLYLHSVPKVLCLVIGLIHKHRLETWRSCARAVAGPGPASPPELVQWGNLGEVVRWAGQCGLMCGVQLAPDTGTGREAAGPAPATTIVFSGSLGVQQTQGDRGQCGTSPVTGARGK